MEERQGTKVLVMHDAPELYLDILKDRVPEARYELCKTAHEVEARLEEVQPQVVLSYKCLGIPGPAHLPILACPSVKWIHVGGTGVDHLYPWDARKVTVTNCAGLLSGFLAETTLGAIMMLNFGFHRYLRQQAKKQWQPQPWDSLAGKTLLVIGLGNIGRRAAEKARSQGMKILGIKNKPGPMPEVDEIFSQSQLHHALAKADFVSLHVPITERTHHMINAKALAHMKPSAFLINVARGPVVDEAALISALQEKRIAGAYLDVMETEPLPADSPLWEMEQVVISPHVADCVSDWQLRFASFFAENLSRWIRSERLARVVDLNRGY
ncbi:MAG: D-2-hydroxyacid dehydrogenase [Pseudomonadota bacterium]